MTLDELLKQEQERRDERLNHTYKLIKDCEAKIIAGENIEQNLSWLESACYENQQAYEATRDNKWVDNLKADFELFKSMSYTLKNELDATIEDDKITYRGVGKSVSFNVKMIAAMFNLHPGMFGFDSSFTTHEAYTETGRLIHIGISRDDEDAIIINFHFIKNN